MAISSKEAIQTSEIFVGNIDAPVTLTIFIDYESQVCAAANVVLNEILEAYSDSIRINYRHFPLSNKHQNAMKAAEAAVGAAQEGLFTEMHNTLFANRKKLGRISLQSYARQIGTTNKRFLDQVINGNYAWQVREDLLLGLERGVRDVPAIFINDEDFTGEVSFKGISEAIEIKLRKED